MASYASYKKVHGDQMVNGTLSDNDINSNTLNNYGVKWISGVPCRCSGGCCCNWTVPTGVCRMVVDLWGAGGNGAGACSCNRCHHFKAAMGGSHNTKTVGTKAGCTYRLCAAGVYRCLSRECVGCNGCTTYANGYNMSGFCACGGYRAESNTSWSNACFYTNAYCRCPTHNNGEMYVVPNNPGWSTAGTYCKCHPQEMHQGVAPIIGGISTMGNRNCWMKCGCWSVPYGTGGQSAMNTYCGRCCGQGGTGGGGLIRVTYI